MNSSSKRLMCVLLFERPPSSAPLHRDAYSASCGEERVVALKIARNLLCLQRDSLSERQNAKQCSLRLVTAHWEEQMEKSVVTGTVNLESVSGQQVKPGSIIADRIFFNDCCQALSFTWKS